MSEQTKDKTKKNQSKEKTKDEDLTLADKAAEMFGWKKGKLPKDWCRVIIKRKH